MGQSLEHALINHLAIVTTAAQPHRPHAHSSTSSMSQWVIPLLIALLSAGATTTLQAAEPTAPQDETGVLGPNAMPEEPDVTTGSAGTTSSITGADMDQEDQTTGGGETQGDEIFQTPPAASDEGPSYETKSPEREEGDDGLPDEPLGAELTGHQDDEPQASTEDSPE